MNMIKKGKAQILAFFILVFFLLIGIIYVLSFYNPFETVCHLVSDNIYIEIKKVIPWEKQCLLKAQKYNFFSNREVMITELNHLFEDFHVSHLFIYKKQEVKRIWNSESYETGIHAQFVDGELVVINIDEGSAAAELNIKRGDIIKAINNDTPSEEYARKTSGEFKVVRINKEYIFHLKSKKYTVNESPKIYQENNKLILKIPSFRTEFFENDVWKETVEKVNFENKPFILDLRGNLGGNFISGMRFLSSVFCSINDVGFLGKENSMASVESLNNTLEEIEQKKVLIKNIKNKQLLALKTFSQMPCLTHKISYVLVDRNSASTSEIVAESLKEINHTPIYGVPTSGEVLVGNWIALKSFGPSIYISIPIAKYISIKGITIEGPGVQIDKILYYNLNDLKQGIDSWIF